MADKKSFLNIKLKNTVINSNLRKTLIQDLLPCQKENLSCVYHELKYSHNNWLFGNKLLIGIGIALLSGPLLISAADLSFSWNDVLAYFKLSTEYGFLLILIVYLFAVITVLFMRTWSYQNSVEPVLGILEDLLASK